MGIDRSEVIARMRSAFRTGQNVGSFINDMKAAGISYRRTTMLSDWRSINELETKGEAFKYVRKDYYPTTKSMADVEWNLSQEFMYKVKVRTRTDPTAPITERYVNIMSDVPMTPRMVEQALIEKWITWEKYGAEIIEDIVPVTAVHRSELWEA